MLIFTFLQQIAKLMIRLSFAVKLCQMYLFLNNTAGKHHVFLGPTLFHFTKDVNTFKRFAIPGVEPLRRC